MSNKPVLNGADFNKILDAAHTKFLNAKKLPPDHKQTQVYLILNGLAQHLASMKIELPFDLEDMDAEKPEVGGLDDIG